MAPAARARPLPPLTSPAGLLENGPSVSRAGCAKRPPTKEPLACLVLECQPVAGVRGRVSPVSSSPRPQPPCRPALPELQSGSRPCWPQPAGPRSEGPACPDPPCGPRLPGRPAPCSRWQPPDVAPQNRPGGQLPRGPVREDGRCGSRGPEVPERPAPSQCSCSSPQTWAGTASCTWRRWAAAGSGR